jgi:hypothetical protein
MTLNKLKTHAHADDAGAWKAKALERLGGVGGVSVCC